jgi:hypothetical protein
MDYNRQNMNREKNGSTAVSDFTTFLYQKGYRGRFSAEMPAKGKTLFAGKLSDCLIDLLQHCNDRSASPSVLELKTTAPYADNLQCTFSLRYDEIKGFLITGAAYRDTKTGLGHSYAISNNQQLPGANSIEGLFPKPKPWDNHLKGKFRP